MKFSDIPSHHHIKQRLQQMVKDDRIPSTLLIHGPEGSGKFLLARALAQLIHCENPGADGEPCQECASCKQHATLNHIDTFYCFPVQKEEGMKEPPVSEDFMDQWREFIIDYPFMDFDAWTRVFAKKNAQPIIYVNESNSILHHTSTTAHAAKYKVVILWLPEKLKIEAANKLLKILEEPHADTLFILVSNDAPSILPTILSRCMRIEVPRLSDEDTAHYLEANRAMDPSDALALAHVAEGNVNEALRRLDSKSSSNVYLELFIRLMRLAYQRKVAELRAWANDVTALGREGEVAFMEYCQRLIRENFIANFATPELNYMNSAESDFSRNFARFINEKNAWQIVEALNKAAIDIDGNGNGKIVNFDLAIQIIFLLIRQ